MARRGKRQVREGRSLSLQQSRPFLSSAEGHLAAISARLYPMIYTVFPQCFVWFCAVERTKAHLSAPLRAGSVGTFLGPSQSKGTSSGAAVALRGERSTWQQAWKTAAEVTQSKLCNAQQRVSRVWSSAVGLFLFSHKTPVEDKYSVSFRRVTSTAIPSFCFLLQTETFKACSTHTPVYWWERRGNSPVLCSPEMWTFQELVLTMLVRRLLTCLLILSGKFVPELRRLPR